jgi:hypothetical protein
MKNFILIKRKNIYIIRQTKSRRIAWLGHPVRWRSIGCLRILWNGNP